MLDELAKLHQALPNLTVLYVTHDQVEALTLADRIAIMRDGKLVSYGRSQALYKKPPNRFTAEFLGRANLIDVTIEGDAGPGEVHVRCGEDRLLAPASAGLKPGANCLLCIRPHEVGLDAMDGPCNTVHGVVESTVWQGDQHHIAVEAAGTLVRVVAAPMDRPPEPGTRLTLHFRAAHGVLIPADA
jgi:2-aminoethylphosphonate transport system ATP-binding protein